MRATHYHYFIDNSPVVFCISLIRGTEMQEILVVRVEIRSRFKQGNTGETALAVESGSSRPHAYAFFWEAKRT